MSEGAVGADSSSVENLLGSIVQDFSARMQRGAAPSIEEYAARHPEHADEIREILTTVTELEGLEPPGADASPVAGAQLGTYRLERELGRGGMGVVFLATDEELGRRVALKLLPLHATLDRRFVERFRREARAAAGLQHANIVPVYGVGEHGGVHFYVMRFVEGLPLDHIVGALDESSSAAAARSEAGEFAAQLVQRPLPGSGSDDGSGSATRAEPWQDEAGQARAGIESRGSVYARNVARIGKHVASALAYAHARGILHRDVKPGNLLLDGEGRVWVADFGLCKTSEADPLTGSADVVGTLRYMAPEQLRGESDVRTDVYGLGVSLYELLTGRPPFADVSRERLFDRVMNHEPPRPRRVEPSVPRDLEAIVLRAMAKLPEERYGTAEAMAHDLEAYLTGRPIAARPPSVLHLLRLVVRRNRLVTATIATALLLLLVASVLYVRGVGEERRERELQLALANLAAAEVSLEVDPLVARDSLERVPPQHRGWEWKHFAALVDQSIGTVAEGLTSANDVAVTPDGRLVLAGADRSLWIGELAEGGRVGKAWRLPTPRGAVWDVAVSPDGLRAATAHREGQLLLWSLEGEPARVATRDLPFGIDCVAFAPDGQRLYAGDRAGIVRGFDLGLEPVLEPILEIKGHESWAREIAVLPDGRVITAGYDGEVRIGDPESGESRLLADTGTRLLAIDVDPDGRRVAVGGRDRTVRVLEIETGLELHAFARHRGEVLRVLFSPDGRWLLSGSADKTIRVWDLERGIAVRTLHGHSNMVKGLAFAADDLLFSSDLDGRVLRWDVEAGGGSLALIGHLPGVWSTRFDARGERIVSTGRDGTVRLWDAATGTELRVLVGHPSTPYRACFSSDGRRIVSGDAWGHVLEWDVATGEPIAELERGDSLGIQGLDLSPAGELFVRVTGRVELWRRSPEGWSEVHRVERSGLRCAAVDAEGRLVVGSEGGGLELFEAGTLAALWGLDDACEPDALPMDVEFAPDGRTIHLAAGTAVRSFDARDGRRRGAFEVGGNVWAIACAPDGERLVCASENLGIVVWSLASGEPLARVSGSAGRWGVVDVSADGRRIVSAAQDGSLQLWDDATADERRARLTERRALAPAAEVLLERLVADDPPAVELPHRLFPRILTADAPPDVRAAALERAHARSGTRTAIEARVRHHLQPGTREDARLAAVLGYGLGWAYGPEPRMYQLYSEAVYRWGAYDAGAYEQARRRFVVSLESVPEEGPLRLEATALLAMTLARLDRPDEARAALDEARTLAAQREPEAHGAELLAEAEALITTLAEDESGS